MTPASRLRDAASNAPRTAGSWLESLARLGYVSTATVYTLIGLIAFGAAFGRSGRDANARDALQLILHQPFGRVLLAVVAFGLIGYATWRFVSSVNDAERDGNSPGGFASRAFGFFRGLVYLGLAIEALRMVMKNSSSDSGGEHWTARLMEMPFGKWLVLAAALGLAAYAVHQMYRASVAKLSDQLRMGAMDPAFRRKVVAVSRVGIAARGLVLAIIGFTIAASALEGRANEQTTGDALKMLGSWNHWLLAGVGLGFVAYGLYQLVNARYRMIRTSS